VVKNVGRFHVATTAIIYRLWRKIFAASHCHFSHGAEQTCPVVQVFIPLSDRRWAWHARGYYKRMNTTLTRREKDVLLWASEGKSAWEIGVILSISERTVKFHLSNIYRKFEVSTRAQAIVYALRNDLLEQIHTIKRAS